MKVPNYREALKKASLFFLTSWKLLRFSLSLLRQSSFQFLSDLLRLFFVVLGPFMVVFSPLVALLIIKEAKERDVERKHWVAVIKASRRPLKGDHHV